MSDQLDTFGLQIQELSNDIESQSENIGTLEEFDQNVAANITDLAEEIAYLGEFTQDEITMLQQNVTENEVKISLLEDNIAAVDGFDDRIGSNEDKINGHETEIAKLTENVVHISDDVNELYNILEDHDELVKEIANNFTIIDAGIAKIEDSIGAADERIKANEVDIDSVNTTVHENDEKIIKNEAAVENLSFDVSELNSSVDEINTIIKEYDDQFDSLQKNLIQTDQKIDQVQFNFSQDLHQLEYDIHVWQLNMDKRVSQTENQIEGENFRPTLIHSSKYICSDLYESITGTPKPPTDECA